MCDERWFSSRLSRELCSISCTWQSSVCQLSFFIVKTKCHLLLMSSMSKKNAVRNFFLVSHLMRPSLKKKKKEKKCLTFFVLFFPSLKIDGTKPFSEIPGPRSIPFFGSQWLYIWPGPYSLEKLHIANQGFI